MVSRASSTVEKKGKKETPDKRSDIADKGSVNDQIVCLMAKMNHSDWEKRKDSAEAII